MRLFVKLQSEPEEFHIYIYAKSYFYRFQKRGIMISEIKPIKLKLNLHLHKKLLLQKPGNRAASVSQCEEGRVYKGSLVFAGNFFRQNFGNAKI